MTIRRYSRAPILGGGRQYGTSNSILAIREGIENGDITFDEHILQEGERLDVLAGKAYNDASLYWVIASASNVGFALQVPPGTLIKIPKDLDVIAGLVG